MTAAILLQLVHFIIRLTHQQDNGSPYLTSADFPAPTTRYNQTSELLNRLLEDYDIRLRPNFGGKSLDLKMDVLIASFDEISEVNMDYTITMYLHQYWDHSIFHTFQDYTITMYLHQYWSDDRLAWSSTRNESMTLSGDFADRIWVPDTFLANDKKSFLHDVTETNKMLRLHSDGFLVYGMRFTTTLACNMNLRYYPLDSQECTVEIESYGYTTEDIMMYWKDNRSSVKGVKRAKIAQFTILGFDTQSKVETTATDGEMYYISGWEVHDTVTHRLGGSYQRISLRFHLQRNIGYFIFQTYLPSILIVMLSWVSFWINHEATSARVALGITTVLTMTTISTGVRATLPRISYIKAIDIYLVMSFVFVFAALLEYAAVNYSYWGSRAKRKNKHKEKPKEYDENKWGSFSEDDDEQGPSATSSLQTTMMPVQQQDNTTRMSPIPSLRAGGPHEDNDQTARPLYPPRARNPIYSTSGRLRYRGGSVKGHNANTAGVENSARRRNRAILNAMRSKARAVKINIPRIKNINLIDKYSRIVFPACFAAFNLFYWLYYTFTTPSPDN